MKLDRRQFLGAAIASAGTMVIAQSTLRAEEAKDAAINPYEMVPLGKTGLKVSRIGLGTGMSGSKRESNQTRLGKDKFGALIKEAYDRGVRLYDMADLYGSMPYVGPALKANREKCVFLTKIWVMGGGIPEEERPDADVVIDRFRKELQTDYIDIVLLHCQTQAKWPEQQKRYLDSLAKLKDKGIIKACGISAHHLDALKTAAATPWCDTVNVRINHSGQSMDGKPEEVAPVLKMLHDVGKGVVGMKVVGEGKWKTEDKADMRTQSIKYILGLGSVDSMVVGFESVKEVDDFEKRVVAVMKEMKTKTA
jgi:aryl-alcohol dehydrogenase-like predicted oxidoreductase